jgi:hypothetical protein
MAKAENNLLLSPNYLNIQKKAQRGERLQENDWEIVRQLTNEYFPNFYDFMTYSLKHDSTEQQICLLLRLHFKAGGRLPICLVLLHLTYQKSAQRLWKNFLNGREARKN